MRWAGESLDAEMVGALVLLTTLEELVTAYESSAFVPVYDFTVSTRWDTCMAMVEKFDTSWLDAMLLLVLLTFTGAGLLLRKS